ncbi:unnamed protein product [Mytilus edulis]|uniref:Uncharacterized protein n=1 Tax=Mytilus edulis TaxID=6550 RepID=A0A8S3PYK4_MYTED|nr:unnamed protein product [Mytilus edulis]
MYDFPTKRHFSIFAQLRTGYTELNYYKNRVGQTNAIESCNCGAPETPQHFLLECPYYEKEREDMLHQISKEVGVRNLNLATMLTRLDGENTEETKPNYKQWHITLTERADLILLFLNPNLNQRIPNLKHREENTSRKTHQRVKPYIGTIRANRP